jgi:hypothetical protein
MNVRWFFSLITEEEKAIPSNAQHGRQGFPSVIEIAAAILQKCPARGKGNWRLQVLPPARLMGDTRLHKVQEGAARSKE